MKKIQGLLMVLAMLLMGYSATLHAEDTDIYVGNSTNNGVPNVLFVIDTSAAFDADAAVCSYGTGGVSSLTGKAGGIEQCALVDAITALADSSVNIGIMTTNGQNYGDDVRNTTDVSYHEVCPSAQAGGCLLRKLTLMNAANKTNLINFIKSWARTGSSSSTQFVVKSNTSHTGGMMQEAWAYYNGKIGMSGKNYGTSILASGCQKNFVILIGNAFGNSGTPGDGTVSPYDGLYGMTAAQTGATTAQKTKISETVKFSPATCANTTSLAPTTAASDWSENWADEWARLMFQQDGGTSTMEGNQNITTYTIGVVDPALGNACKPDYPALLTTTAKYGGGKYFAVSTANEVRDALLAILNEVQAVNSVFSSASLPVSVNAEGSFLNQIFLGMFRPDATAAPRWVGNLKQYQLVKNQSGILVLGDSTGAAAISASGTGFLSPNAISYWTSKVVATVPDSGGGFFVNDKKGVPESGYDLPDGEVVEKGGVAQKLRMENLTSTFTGATGASGNPRRLYTYCPSGTGCVAALTDVSNDFATTNSGIASTAFGASSTIPITSIVRTGTSALVTTSGNHGFSTGTTVTVSNATQTEYNVTQNVTVNSNTTFTITGLPDYPTTPNAGTYTVSRANNAATPMSTLVRGTSTTGSANTTTVTVTTSAAHGLVAGNTVTVAGVTPSMYNGNWLLTGGSGLSLTFNTPVYPVAPAVNSYKAVPLGYTRAITKVVTTGTSTKVATVTTSSAHGFHVGQTVTVSGTGEPKYDGSQTVTGISPSTPSVTFTFTTSGSPATKTVGSVAPSTTGTTISTLTRTGTTVSATATATVSASNFFTNGDTVTISTTGTSPNETAYALSNVVISCTSPCTTFTYPITTTPSTPATTTGTVALAGGSASITAGQITRSGTTATVTSLAASTFTSGDVVNIAASGTALSSESGYVGTWTISCPLSTCTSFTFGTVAAPIPLTPVTPATGSNMQAYSGSTPPDKDTLVKWVRGADNYGDEKGPGGTVTVRPSIHGDVLHSRPLVINYGDSRGIVVFYGANDGIYRAVNGNQSAAMGSIPAGGELWGLILPDHFNEMTRLRLNSPELKFPSTTLSSAQPKDYFVDGPTGAYQKLKADGTIDKAYIYLTMRRGGNFLYALDVSNPTAPTVLWKIDQGTTGFDELGQTWSRPRVTLIQGGGLGTTPVVVFGAGYDAAQDAEPPTTNTQGRGIYVVNATTGALIWSATPTCTTSSTCLNVPQMTYAIPSDISFVDRDQDGYTDKFYFGDTGGNVWRADVNTASTLNWKVSKLAALGCDTGECAAGTTPRKFFFPPSILTIKASGAVGSYDAVSIASGDREHPLKSSNTSSAYYTQDHFFMISDTGTTVGTTATVNVTPANLFNATSTTYNGTLNGFYVDFPGTGEKAVNAPLAVSGNIFFATNRPTDPSNQCSTNLGEAKAYKVDPFLGTQQTNVLSGGGLPPSAVTGLIIISTTDSATGTTTTSQEKFCIGCGLGINPDTGGTCNSALENCSPDSNIPKNLRRTYWYKR